MASASTTDLIETDVTYLSDSRISLNRQMSVVLCLQSLSDSWTS